MKLASNTAVVLNDYYRHKEILSNKLIEKIHKSNKTAVIPINIPTIENAIRDVKKWHGNQRRQTGEPYYLHPLEVAINTINDEPDTDTVVAAIFHDILEDTEISEEEIETTYGGGVIGHVKDLTRKKRSSIPNGISSTENLFLLAMKKKRNLMLVKIHDRTHNLQTIYVKDRDKRKKIANETYDYFIPACEYLEDFYPGMRETKTKLHKLCTPHL